MKRLIKILQDNHIECLPNERFSLDVELFPENGEEHPFPKQVLFEFPKLQGGKKGVPEAQHSMFRFFLDGSQRSHRVIEASFKSHYLPICAGQVGVAVLEREDTGRMVPRRDLTKVENILAVPNILEEDNAKSLEHKINREMPANDHFRIVRYDYQAKDDKDPADLGRAMIIHEMQMLELGTIKDMIANHAIRDERMLVKDGGLQYRDTKIKDLNLSKDDLVQLRNVIGLAKTFKANMTLGQGRGRQDLGNLTKGLDWKERTTVISPNKHASTTHGWWYLRLRPRDKIYNPLQGIGKIEVFVSDTEKLNDGIAQERADTISSYVLLERNVTPYNADTRWASHIYPIYLAETYLRSSFLSHERFKALII
jgi:hypothetical protein